MAILSPLRDSSLSMGLRFDENLSRFAGYDIDICLLAHSRGTGVFVIDIPMEHRTSSGSGDGFGEAMDYITKKWGQRYPLIYTTYCAIRSTPMT